MPFCRECGSEIKLSMKFCPNCASPQKSLDKAQSSSFEMQDSVISGDVNIVQNTLAESKEERIDNLANVMIDKLSRGDMKSARDCWNQAKMIDIVITEKLFNNKYSKQIVNGYHSIAESELDEFSKLFYTNPPYLDPKFHESVRLAPINIKLALENSTSFENSNKSFRYNLLHARLNLYSSWFTGGKCSTTWDLNECNELFEKHLKKAKENVTPLQQKSLESLVKEYTKLQERRKMQSAGEATLIVILLGICVLGFVFVSSL